MFFRYTHMHKYLCTQALYVVHSYSDACVCVQPHLHAVCGYINYVHNIPLGELIYMKIHCMFAVDLQVEVTCFIVHTFMICRFIYMAGSFANSFYKNGIFCQMSEKSFTITFFERPKPCKFLKTKTKICHFWCANEETCTNYLKKKLEDLSFISNLKWSSFSCFLTASTQQVYFIVPANKHALN